VGRQWLVREWSGAGILFDALTNPLFGLATPAWQINASSFDDANALLATEGLGQSMLVGDSSGPQISTFQQLREECERTAGGVLRRNADTFQWEFKLIRDEAATPEALAALPHFDERHLRVTEWVESDPSETINSVTVTFTNAELIYQRDTITVRNEANIAMTGSVRPLAVEYLSVTSRETAFKLAARDLKEHSTPLARGSAKGTRALWRVGRGDAIRLSNVKHDLDDRLVRVLSVDLGTPESGEITITVAEDVFGIDLVTRTFDPTPQVPTGTTIIRPTVTAKRTTVTSTTGTFAFTVLDPEHRIISIETLAQVGSGAPVWTTIFTASADTSDTRFPFDEHVTDGDANGNYTADVARTADAPSYSGYRITYITTPPASAPESVTETLTDEVEIAANPALIATSTRAIVVRDGLGGVVFVVNHAGQQILERV
jgi:hypothetical protein